MKENFLVLQPVMSSLLMLASSGQLPASTIRFGKINCAKRTVQKHRTVVCSYLMLRRHDAYYSFIMMEIIYEHCYHRHVLHKPPNWLFRITTLDGCSSKSLKLWTLSTQSSLASSWTSSLSINYFSFIISSNLLEDLINVFKAEHKVILWWTWISHLMQWLHGS